MYKTKFPCHEKNTKDFVSVGDNYLKPKVRNPRFRGKQFLIIPPKAGQTAGTFEKFPEHKADVYTDKYKLNPKGFKISGFGSNDAERRCEYASDVLSRQWKEKLKVEMKVARGAIFDDEVEDLDVQKATFRMTYPQINRFQTQVPFHSLDVGKTEANSTPICNKCSRETFYCRHRVKGELPETVNELRRPQGFNQALSPTSYNTYGSWTSDPTRGNQYQLAKPVAGRIRTTKQFFDNSHMIPGW